MFIFPKHRITQVHFNKTGGTSLRSYLESAVGESAAMEHGKHSTMAEALDRYGRRHILLTTIRNPYRSSCLPAGAPQETLPTRGVRLPRASAQGGQRSVFPGMGLSRPAAACRSGKRNGSAPVHTAPGRLATRRPAAH